MIAAVDEFVLFDDMQYTRRDWRNRNLIKTPQGAQWLTVPVRVKGKYFQKIRETEIEGDTWREDHWKALVQNYGRAQHFAEISSWLKPLYLDRGYAYLSDLNETLLKAVCMYLGIKTNITRSERYQLAGERTERLASICRQAGGEEYVSGPSARDYVDSGVFEKSGVKLTWFDYDGYPEYPQQWGGFKHDVSILDLLFNCGGQAASYMRNVRR